MPSVLQRRWLLGVVAGVVAPGPLMGCSDPTEVVIFIDTTLGVPCQIDEFDVTVVSGPQRVVRRADPADGQQSVTVLQDGAEPNFGVDVAGSKEGQRVAIATGNLAFTEEASRSLSVVLDESCPVDAPCSLEGQLQPFQVPAAATRRSCDGISNRYEVRLARFRQTTNACEVGSNLFEAFEDFGADGAERTLSNQALIDAVSNFNFLFYGQPIETLWVADDGYISFGAQAPAALASLVSQDDVTAPGAPPSSVLAFWDNLGVRSSTRRVCVSLLEDQGLLWVTWDNVCFEPACAGTDSLTFSIGLEAQTNAVILHYDTMDSATLPERALGNDAAVGVRGPGTPACSASECSETGSCPNGQACGYTQYFAESPQEPASWPTTIEFIPVPEN